MYSYIKGTLVELTADAIVVENQGIGYNIRIPGSILTSLEGVGQEVKIYTYTYIREDAMHLYGFLTREDRRVFELLIGVSGIGPKGALAILSVMTPDDLRFAVLGEDEKTIAKAPGIGKKTAQRLIIELKDQFDLAETFAQASAHGAAQTAVNLSNERKNDAVQALVALGYSAAEATRAVAEVAVTEETGVEEILKESLKHMAL